MNLKKIITNTLAVVGAVVIIDRIVEVVTNKGTKAVCEELNTYDVCCEDEDQCHCGCDCDYNESDESEPSYECDESCSCNHEDAAFPDIKKYDEEDKHTFQYTIKTENITSDPTEV